MTSSGSAGVVLMEPHDQIGNVIYSKVPSRYAIMYTYWGISENYAPYRARWYDATTWSAFPTFWLGIFGPSLMVWLLWIRGSDSGH